MHVYVCMKGVTGASAGMPVEVREQLYGVGAYTCPFMGFQDGTQIVRPTRQFPLHAEPLWNIFSVKELWNFLARNLPNISLDLE